MELRLRVVGGALVVLICVWEAVGQNAEFTDEEMDMAAAKCELCKSAVKLLHKEIEQTDPSKQMVIGSFRLKADGSSSQRQVPYKGSESHLQDLLDDNVICGKMRDIVPVADKETGALSMLHLVEEMLLISKYNFFPDPDLNSRMNTLCQEMFGNHEDELLDIYKTRSEKTRSAYTLGLEFCHEAIHYCPTAEKLDSLKTSTDEVGVENEDEDEAEGYHSPTHNSYDPRDEL